MPMSEDFCCEQNDINMPNLKFNPKKLVWNRYLTKFKRGQVLAKENLDFENSFPSKHKTEQEWIGFL